MTTTITQRELRNSSGDIMRRLDAGETLTSRALAGRSASSARCADNDSSAPTPCSVCSIARQRSTPNRSVPISTGSPMPGSIRVPEHQLERGILDTSVVIDLERLEPSALPREVAVTSICLRVLETPTISPAWTAS